MSESESGIELIFPESYSVQKFDNTGFYRQCFNVFPASKAVDFLASSDRQFMFIEVKNCHGNEAENRWRVETDNQKRDTTPTPYDVSDRDSVDIEVAQKVAMTISALVGVLSNPTPHRLSEECASYAEALCSQQVHRGQRKLFVILVLEGEFANGLQTRTNEMIHQRILQSIQKKLRWLNCTVLVTNTAMMTTSHLPITATRRA